MAETSWTLLDSLAGGNLLNYPAVLATDAETCLLKLHMLSAQAAYQQRLHKLLHKPPNP